MGLTRTWKHSQAGGGGPRACSHGKNFKIRVPTHFTLHVKIKRPIHVSRKYPLPPCLVYCGVERIPRGWRHRSIYHGSWKHSITQIYKWRHYAHNLVWLGFYSDTVEPRYFEFGLFESPLFRSQADFPLFDPHLDSLGYFETPLFRTIFHVGLDCETYKINWTGSWRSI